MNRADTIVALATGAGGAISVIRVSGESAMSICDTIFQARNGQRLVEAKGYTMHFGDIVDHAGEVVDEVIISVMRSPRSYTGEDMAEISCHASQYITREIISLLTRSGARTATAGEFTTRAFLAGKLDLAQAEAVADMIAAENRTAHLLATKQLKGGYSAEFSTLRTKLIELVSLLELELDFGEEDVEFAQRDELREAIEAIMERVTALRSSFTLGNAIKQGVATVIAGKPNVGKSTLLNRLLMEDRAMVSDIAGTTRDVIEEQITINGIRFRFIDTAGIRQSDDKLEQMGIERTFGAIDRAAIVILLVDPLDIDNIAAQVAELGLRPEQRLCIVVGKSDLQAVSDVTLNTVRNALNISIPDVSPDFACDKICNSIPLILISAKEGSGIAELSKTLSNLVMDEESAETLSSSTVVCDTRHYEALNLAHEALSRSLAGLQSGLSSDLLTQDIRQSLHHIGTITGEITTNDILTTIFSKFCIGK